MSVPTLTVIIPVYNASRYLSDAITSILSQTCRNLELVIINDGSTDNSMQVVQSFPDDRIRYFENEKNRGIVFSRNRGVKEARGAFVGMLDADDIAYPEKFEKQIAFLKENPEFGFVGSWARLIDENGNRLKGGWKLKASPGKIPSIMLFKNYFLQSAVLYRKTCLQEYSFADGFDILEDYLIWYQILKKYKGWNLPEYLTDYRVHSGSVTRHRKQERIEKEKKVFKIMFDDIGLHASKEELELHMLIREGLPVDSPETLKALENWLLKILYQNSKSKVYDPSALTRVIINRWLKVCSKISSVSFKSMHICLSSKLFNIFISNNRNESKGA